MPAQPNLSLRVQELGRRVEALPAEIAAWRALSTGRLEMNAHFSQVAAIAVLVDALVRPQREALAALDPAGPDPEAFRRDAFGLVKQLYKAQGVWDYFRDKLELRFSEKFKDPLWVADTIAWDCYRPVMDRAADAGIVPRAEVREPPLTYLTAQFSPATWVRGQRPNDGRDYALGQARLPIPVIEIPWDHIENLWELMSIHHEVGHDLESDLKLRGAMQGALQTALNGAQVDSKRIPVWLAWQAEVFADVVGLQLGGPAFAEALMHLLMLPEAAVTTYDPDDPHPTHYVRLLMNAAYVRTLAGGAPGVIKVADDLAARWTGMYGPPQGFPEVAPFLDDLPHVFQALMDTPLPALKGSTVRQLIPYTAADDARIASASNYLVTGQNAPGLLTLPPRHCASAARVAAAAAAAAGDDGTTLAGKLDGINKRVAELVHDQAAPGLRAGDGSTPHERFIASFAARL